MAGTLSVKLFELLKSIGVDVSQQQASNVKKLAPKNKSTSTKVGLLAAERDTGGNFATVLDIFKKDAQYIDSMNDVEKMNFLNNIMDYKEFGGSSIKNTEGIKLLDEAKNLTDEAGDLQTSISDLQSTAKTMKDDAEAGLASAKKDLDDFITTGGQPLKAKSDKYLGGSMHEEGQLRTAIRTFLKNEYKNGRIKLDKDDQFRIMEYSPMMEDDPIKVFKKIYGDEAYNKAGTFPGAFEKGENFNHYEQIFKENMGEDILKVKDKKYVGDGTLTLTKQEEVFEPKPDVDDDGVPFAKGGRASFAGGKLADELVAMLVKKEPMDAMKELNKIIGKKGNYKNLTQEDIDKIVNQTNDHIFQRDPDNLFKNVDDMSIEDSLTTLEGLGGTKMAERFRLKQRYPGISEDLLTNIIEDIDPVHKASVLAKIDMAMELGKTNKSADEIIDILKKEPETKMATGGRAGYYSGGQAMIEPDLSDIGHGSDSLMARTRLTAPGSQATTSTGLNYLLGEDNDNIRVPFNEGLLVPPKKPYTEEMFKNDSMMSLKGMYGTGPDSNIMLYNEMIKKGNKLREKGVDRKTVIEIIRNNKDKIDAFLETQKTFPKSFKGIDDFEMKAKGGRIRFQGGGGQIGGTDDMSGGKGDPDDNREQYGAVGQYTGPTSTNTNDGPDDKPPVEKTTVIQKIKNNPYINNPITRTISRLGLYAYNPTVLGTDVRTLMQAKDLYDNINDIRTKYDINNPDINEEEYGFASGGITGLRQGYAGGKGVDIARRGFLKFLGGTAAGVAALKLGLTKILGKESGAISKKAIDEVIIEGGSGAPAWLQPLVNKALREGTDISKQAVKDGQVVKSLDTPTGKVDVYYDTRTGEIDIDYIGGNTALGESVNMRYVPGVADEGTKGVKPADEFEASEAIPEGQMSSPNDYNVELGENVTGDVKELYSDTSELAELGGEKLLIKDISTTIKKKKVLKQMNENPDKFASDNLRDDFPNYDYGDVNPDYD